MKGPPWRAFFISRSNQSQKGISIYPHLLPIFPHFVAIRWGERGSVAKVRAPSTLKSSFPMRFLALTAVAAVALLASPLTHARGPMVTQSADVIGPGECEAEGSLARDEFRFGRQQFHASTQGLRGACAVADGHQVGLRYERQTAGNERVHVFGIEGKSRLWKDEAFGGALSFDWVVAGTRGAFGQGNRYAGRVRRFDSA
jgi:hypothetical protein